MSLAAQTASALVRAGCIAIAAVALSGWLAPALAGLRGRAKSFAWALLLAPFFTPALLISYAFSRVAFALAASPWSHHALYAAVLLLKLVPVAVVARWLMPPPLSAEARYCHRLLVAPSFLSRVRFALRGSGSGPWFAGGLVFLLAFADFEMASLWGIKTWAVVLFDAQTGGLGWRESLHLAAWPLVIQVTVLAMLASWKTEMRSAPMRARKSGRTVFGYLTTVAFVITILPLALVSTQAVSGFQAIGGNFVLGNEIIVSVLFAVCAAAVSFGIAHGTHVLPGIPGLLGSLLVALLVLALFQIPLLRPLYDTPLPLLLALTILLLPLAVLLKISCIGHTSPMRHIARQLASRRLFWELEMRPRLAAFALLFCAAYFDFTASAILAPTRFTPVFVRLHNLAHYGQTAILSAMMLAAFAVPIVLLLMALAAGKIYARRDAR